MKKIYTLLFLLFAFMAQAQFYFESGGISLGTNLYAPSADFLKSKAGIGYNLGFSTVSEISYSSKLVSEGTFMLNKFQLQFPTYNGGTIETKWNDFSKFRFLAGLYYRYNFKFKSTEELYLQVSTGPSASLLNNYTSITNNYYYPENSEFTPEYLTENDKTFILYWTLGVGVQYGRFEFTARYYKGITAEYPDVYNPQIDTSQKENIVAFGITYYYSYF